jgi:hypothetical protein
LSTFLDVRRIRWLAEQAAAERNRIPHRFEGVGRQFLGHQADQERAARYWAAMS